MADGTFDSRIRGSGRAGDLDQSAHAADVDRLNQQLELFRAATIVAFREHDDSVDKIARAANRFLNGEISSSSGKYVVIQHTDGNTIRYAVGITTIRLEAGFSFPHSSLAEFIATETFHDPSIVIPRTGGSADLDSFDRVRIKQGYRVGGGEYFYRWDEPDSFAFKRDGGPGISVSRAFGSIEPMFPFVQGGVELIYRNVEGIVVDYLQQRLAGIRHQRHQSELEGLKRPE